MTIQPIRNDEALSAALARIDELWGAEPGTPQGDELDLWATLVDAYESKHHALPPGDPIALIGYKMRELNINQAELARMLRWSSGRTSEVLNHRRPLTLAMIRQLSTVLDIPSGLLVGTPAASTAGRWLFVPAARHRAA